MKNDLQELKSLRNRRRQFNRELKKINEEFDDLIRNFENVFFSYDWNDKNIHEIFIKMKIEDKFNLIWLKFSHWWNENKNHVAKVDSFAFRSYLGQYEKPIRQFTPFDEKTEEIPELIISKFEKQ
jgi:hypothetical protein